MQSTKHMVNAATNGSKETLTALQEDPDLAQFLLPLAIQQDVKLNRRVALKVLRSSGDIAARFLAR